MSNVYYIVHDIQKNIQYDETYHFLTSRFHIISLFFPLYIFFFLNFCHSSMLNLIHLYITFIHQSQKDDMKIYPSINTITNSGYIYLGFSLHFHFVLSSFKFNPISHFKGSKRGHFQWIVRVVTLGCVIYVNQMVNNLELVFFVEKNGRLKVLIKSPYYES